MCFRTGFSQLRARGEVTEGGLESAPRWTRVRDAGWLWVPGREWGPAWVSWRTGGDYVGWAPLPPRGRGDDDDNRPINGQVDVEFDIGPAYYNFVDVRYIGDTRLSDRIYAPEQNVTYISTTVNVTNITYTNSTVYNYGPDYNTVNRYSTRPIQRLTLQRDANADLSVAIRSKGVTTVQGDRLVIAAPLTLRKPTTPVAPKVVKQKIDKPNFERGWTGDQKAQAELKQKMKSEDPKKIAPPTVKARENAETVASPNAPATSATTAPVTAASPAVSITPKTTTSPVASASPVASPPPKRKDIPSPVPSSPVPSVTEKAAPSSPPRNKKVAPTQKTVEAPSPVPHQSEPRKPKRDEAAPTPPVREEHPAKAPKKPLPPEKALSPKPEAAAEISRKQPKADLPAEKIAPPKRETPAESEKVAPPKRETPPEAQHKQPPADMPREHTAPPGPGPNGPLKTEGPRKGPDHKKPEASATPGP